MKTLLRSFWLASAVFGLSAAAFASDPAPIRYAVAFKGMPVATQSVTIVQSAGRKTISTAFTADLPVFVATHHYSEQLSVTIGPGGTVERLAAIRNDGPVHTLVSGSLEADGRLRIVREDPGGVATNWIRRGDYDFHSLALYGAAPEDFLGTNQPARVLSVAEGRVLSVAIQAIAESDTFERQHLASTHLVWTDGHYVSHSWHPERFSNLPRRYVRQSESGEFTFDLIR